MVARSRYIGIGSRPRTPFVNGRCDCPNMDIYPYADGGSAKAFPALFAVSLARLADAGFQYPGGDRVGEGHGPRLRATAVPQRQAEYGRSAGSCRERGAYIPSRPMPGMLAKLKGDQSIDQVTTRASNQLAGFTR
jgi:hypothetical protein